MNVKICSKSRAGFDCENFSFGLLLARFIPNVEFSRAFVWVYGLHFMEPSTASLDSRIRYQLLSTFQSIRADTETWAPRSSKSEPFTLT